MTLSHPFMRPQRSKASWLKSKPAQRVCFLTLALTALFLLWHWATSLDPILLLPDRAQNIDESRGRSFVRVSKEDVANERNPDRSPKPRAAFIVLIRESQLSEILPTIRDIQWAFNDDHGYSYVFLSETVFTPWFQNRINDYLSKMPLKPTASFGLISSLDWNVPLHIDLDKAKRKWDKNMSPAIPYAKSTAYRQMCRYMSGPIFKHPLLNDLDYTWRLEPETKHLCTLKSHWSQVKGKQPEWVERDPFRYMRDEKKKYAWFMTVSEYRATVMTLMVAVNKWRRENPTLLAKNDTLSFVSNDGLGYNLCHYWSNFEIIDLSFTRSEAYTSYFTTLDQAGGFFYERWGDAPVRSIAASLMLNSSEIWQIDYAGYFHPPISQCPRALDPGQVCACDPHDNIDYSPPFVSCRARANKINGLDTNTIVHEINLQNGVIENFKEGEQPYVIPPSRLVTLPSL